MNNNYSFDPMTGQPINQQPTQNTTNMYQQQPVQPQQSFNTYQQPVQPQQSFNTYQQPAQPQQPKKNNKVFIIIAIVAVIAIIAGIFLFSNQDKKESINNEIPNNSEVENNKPSNEQQNNNSSTSGDLVEEEYTGTKQNLIVATVGHVDHGKSTLTSAITKFYGKYKTADEIDRAPEVKKGNITFNSSF